MTNPIDEINRTHPLLGILRDAADDAEQRLVRRSNLALLEYVPSDPDSEDVLVPPGSVTIFLARGRTELLDSIRAALSDSGGKDLDLKREIQALHDCRKPLDLESAIALFREQPVVGEIIHGRSTLAKNLFVPDDLELSVVPLPYNGGALAEDDFHLVERVKWDAGDRLEGFAVRHAPQLSAAEAEALRLLPADMIEDNVGMAAMCYAATGIAIVAVVIFATYACPGFGEVPRIDDQRLAAIGPEASARELLAVRRRALERR